MCKQEFKDIMSYSKNNPENTIVAISVDDDQDKLMEYVNKLNHDYNIKNISNLLFAWDENKSISLDLFNTNMVPESFVINNKDNKYIITDKIVGKADWTKI